MATAHHQKHPHQEAGGWHCRSVAVWSSGSSTWTAVSWVEGAVAGQQW